MLTVGQRGRALALAALLLAGFAQHSARAETAKFTLNNPVVLTDADGRSVSTADFSGKWLLIYFGYTHCADLCPTGLSIMAEAMSEIGAAADYVQPIFITVDPERDKGEILRRFPAAFDKRMIGLGGTPAQIAATAKALGVKYEKEASANAADYAISHSVQYILIGADGHSAATITAGAPYEIGAEILAELTKAGKDLSRVNNLGAYR